MIRYLQHHEIDFTKWDACVSGASNAMVYGASWYLNIVSPGWDAIVDGDYASVMPLPHRKKWGIHYLFQPPFTQQLGVFGTTAADAFIAAIPRKFKLADIQLNSGNSCSNTSAARKPNLLLDLCKPFDELRHQYAENTRRNIRKAVAAGLKNDPPTALQDIAGLFKKYRGRTIATLTDHDYERLYKLCSGATARGLLEVGALRGHDGTLHAGAIFLRSPHGWIFLFSATHPDGRETGAMSAVIDRFIERHAGEPTYLDFEGSSDPNLYRFYKSFGSEEIVYLQLRINRLPFPFNLFKS